jgi:hypothetical protein
MIELGKSVLSSGLIQHAEADGLNVFFYFCSYMGASSGNVSRLLRSLLSQIIQKHQDLAIYVYDTHFKLHPTPTKKALIVLLSELLQSLGSTRLVVDGIDEWDAIQQKDLIQDLTQIISTGSSSCTCKIMISSRDTLDISRNLRKRKQQLVTISLSENNESLEITRSIGNFIDERLRELLDHFKNLDPDGSILAEIKRVLLDKSSGL